MPLPTALRALAHRDFRLFWSGQLVSLIGTWMQSVGQAWLVLELTNSPLRLGLLGTLQFGPILLFSFMAGAISDRIPKRRLLVGTQSALMLQAFALSGLVWSGQVQYWHIAVLASLYGLVNTLDMPARQAYIADLVGREDLTSAIALNSAVFNGARVVGPAAAGLLVARHSQQHRAGHRRGRPLCRRHAAHRARPEPAPDSQPLRCQLQCAGAAPRARGLARGRSRLRVADGVAGCWRRGRSPDAGAAGHGPPSRLSAHRRVGHGVGGNAGPGARPLVLAGGSDPGDHRLQQHAADDLSR